VLLIIDPSSSVNAVIQRSRATGVVDGRLSGDLVMRFVPQEDQIAVGDIVLTSGLGGNFPKRLVIGQVTAVRQRDFELFQQAAVRPSVDFNRLEVVMVIKRYALTGTQE
jgi:rod shape-determining protein MreC